MRILIDELTDEEFELIEQFEEKEVGTKDFPLLVDCRVKEISSGETRYALLEEFIEE